MGYGPFLCLGGLSHVSVRVSSRAARTSRFKWERISSGSLTRLLAGAFRSLTGCWTERLISCQLSATLSSLPRGTLHRAAYNMTASFHSTSARKRRVTVLQPNFGTNSLLPLIYSICVKQVTRSSPCTRRGIRRRNTRSLGSWRSCQPQKPEDSGGYEINGIKCLKRHQGEWR